MRQKRFAEDHHIRKGTQLKVKGLNGLETRTVTWINPYWFLFGDEHDSIRREDVVKFNRVIGGDKR
jgi:hypothetical protein